MSRDGLIAKTGCSLPLQVRERGRAMNSERLQAESVQISYKTRIRGDQRDLAFERLKDGRGWVRK